jgi:hypothetical protein
MGSSLNDGLTFLDSFPADKMPMESIQKFLRDKYGSGDYRMQLRVEGKLRLNELVSIEAPKEDTPQGDQTMVMVLNQMREMQQQILALAQNRQPSPEEQEMKMLEKMAMYKQLFSNDNQSSNNGLTEMLTVMTQFKELGLINIGNQPPEEEKEKGFLDFLSGLTPMIQSAMESGKQATPPQMPPAPQPQKPVQEAPVVPPEAEQQQDQINLMIGQTLKTLISAAENGDDPENYADMLLDQIPEQYLGELLNVLESDQWFDQLKQLSSNLVVPHETWFTELRQHILGQFDDTENEDTGGKGGNA